MNSVVLPQVLPVGPPPAARQEFSACLGELRGEINAILSGIRKSPDARSNEKAAVMAALLDRLGELQAVNDETDAEASGPDTASRAGGKIEEFLAAMRITLEKTRELSETVPGIAREVDPFIKQAFYLLSAVRPLSAAFP